VQKKGKTHAIPHKKNQKKNEEEEKEIMPKKRKKAPRGYHYMPDGRLMKNSAHKKRKKK
jgi:hypothetical protein